MVLRRTVCGRRPWSEALAGGGPSIPLPSTRKKRSRWRIDRVAPYPYRADLDGQIKHEYHPDN